MSDMPIFAIMYDFDHTLSPKDMQEYAFIPGIGMTPADFWAECNDMAKRNRMDQILAYMYVMRKEARGKLLITRDTLRKLGREVKLFDGVGSWFHRINSYAAKKGMKAEHYIISSGLKEIIEGTSIAGEFKEIYAAEFCYDEDNVPCWPAMAVNYTSKTQFLFRINKGVLDITEDNQLNEYMPEEKRRVPFRNMIYIGDGLTDVPCMKLVRVNGGHSIAVYCDEKRDAVNPMILQGRVNFIAPADYTKGSTLEKTVFAVLDKAAADNAAIAIHLENEEQARREIQIHKS